jgi:hypothetical protein
VFAKILRCPVQQKVFALHPEGNLTQHMCLKTEGEPAIYALDPLRGRHSQFAVVKICGATDEDIAARYPNEHVDVSDA